MTKWWKTILTDLTEKGGMKQSGVKVDNVVLSKRLVAAPVVVVTSQFGYSAHQEKIMRAQVGIFLWCLFWNAISTDVSYYSWMLASRPFRI